MHRIAAITVLSALVLGGSGPGDKQAKPTNADTKVDAAAMPVELSEFDFEALAACTTLTHDIDIESLKGKVLILVTSSGDANGAMTIRRAQRLQQRFKDSGVVALALGSDLGWDAVAERVNSGQIELPALRDTGDKLAKALRTVEATEIFVIDRSGHIRRARLEPKQLPAIVATLVKETPEQAALAVADERVNGRADAKPTAIASGPAADLPEIAATKYRTASWPSQQRVSGARNVQGSKLPVPLGGEVWITEKKSLEGKVLILDFWATWCGPCIRSVPKFAGMQKKFDGQLEVLSISGQNENIRTVKAYLARHKPRYNYLHDSDQAIIRALAARTIPHVLVVSTDGVVRWQGNPFSPSFDKDVAAIVKADPLLRAIRDANKDTSDG